METVNFAELLDLAMQLWATRALAHAWAIVALFIHREPGACGQQTLFATLILPE
jgi:hypothetical protein